MKMTHVFAVLACSMVLAMGCGNSPNAGGKKSFRVAVIPKGTSHEFWKSVEKGARRADAELSDLDVIWKGPTGEGDAAQQISLVESFIADRVDGICLAPLDARALETPVKQAIAAGIPVVIFDSGLSSKDVAITSYVATDNHHGGELAAQEMVRLLGGKGNVILMRYAIGSESTELRESGFLDALAKSQDVHVLSSDKHGGPDEAHAIEAGENLLSTFGDKVDGIFCSNESSTAGMLTVLRRDTRKLAGKVKVLGFDSSAHIVDALNEGVLHGTVLQDPVQIGYRSVMAMHDKLTGKNVKPRIETGETLATKENMGTPRVHELLFPLEGK
ncbi:MAG: substrate-binding domain-containing protein [Planctomycetes bacterium]|nr:substrate-binding domain-containing protein [Planctomycetota bacterium]MBI3843604.1 substrate-binding domain-containing protein [Planctomycetota bacterium]